MSSSSRLVGRERIWRQSLDADPGLVLCNLCHPVNLEGDLLSDFTLGNLVLPYEEDSGKMLKNYFRRFTERNRIRVFAMKSFFRSAQQIPMTESSTTTLAQVEKVLSTHYRWIADGWKNNRPTNRESDELLRMNLERIVD